MAFLYVPTRSTLEIFPQKKLIWTKRCNGISMGILSKESEENHDYQCVYWASIVPSVLSYLFIQSITLYCKRKKSRQLKCSYTQRTFRFLYSHFQQLVEDISGIALLGQRLQSLLSVLRSVTGGFDHNLEKLGFDAFGDLAGATGVELANRLKGSSQGAMRNAHLGTGVESFLDQFPVIPDTAVEKAASEP